MKNRYKITGLILSLAMMLLIACEEEYSAPTAEPNHAMITTSFGDQVNRMQVNGKMTFIDLSRGVQSRVWTFTEDALDTAKNKITTSAAISPKVIFTQTGVHQIKLSQTFAGEVWIGNSKRTSNTYDTIVTVTVLDSVRANFTAKRLLDMSSLTQQNNALNQVIAGREIQFTQNCTGEPSTFVWQIIRNTDGFVKELTGNPGVNKFSSLGEYDVRLTASSTLGQSTILMKNYIKVVPSTDPVDLLSAKINERNQIRLTFSRDMQNPFNCNPAAFTISVKNGSTSIPVSITGFSLDALEKNIVIIGLNQTLYNSDNVQISYNSALGNLATSDFMNATSVADYPVEFVSPNILSTVGYDISFETSAKTDWPYAWWGAPWDKYTFDVSAVKAHSGKKSGYLIMQPEGGAIFQHKKNGANVTFPGKAGKTYEFSVWAYVDQLGDGAGVPDLRFYWAPKTNWGVGPWAAFAASTPTKVWKRYALAVKFDSDDNYSFSIRGSNAGNSQELKVFIDDISVSELELRQ